MLEAMGQTKTNFFETYTRTALRERSIPFIIKAPVTTNYTEHKMKAFARLEKSRNHNLEKIDIEQEREAAMNEKYGIVD